MVSKTEILCGVLAFLAVFSGYDAEQTPTVVEPSQGWHTAAVGSDFTARCESDGPVAWIKRDSEDVKLESHDTQKDNRTASELVLKDLAYRNIGFYDCVQKIEASTVKGSFYLYIDDPVHLMLSRRSIRMVRKSYEPAVVPCRPTAPDVLVKLLGSDRYLVAKSTALSPGAEERDIYFDPRRGFVMPARLMEPARSSSRYMCQFSKRGVLQEMHILLQITDENYDPDDVFLEYPANTREEVLAKAGDTVVLAMDVFTYGLPSHEWNTPQRFYPPPKGIITDESNKLRVENTAGYPWGTRLTILDINENNSGVYSIQTYTKSGHRSNYMTFTVDVGAAKYLTMDMPKVVKVQDYKSIFASCLRKPDGRKFNATWSFKPLACPATGPCEEVVSTIHPSDIDGHSSKNVLSAAVLEAPKLGNLTCSVHFDDGNTESVTKPVILSEAEDGFEVRKVPQKDHLDADATTLQCIVSKYLYSEHVYWIGPDGRVIEDNIISDTGDFTKLTKSENVHSYTLELVFKNVNQSSHGDYRCMAVNYDHVPEFKTYSTIKREPVPSVFYANLDNNTLLATSNSTVILGCQSNWGHFSMSRWLMTSQYHRFQSKSHISVSRWLKDDVDICMPGHHTLEIKNVTVDNSGKYTCELSDLTTHETWYLSTQVIVYVPDETKSADTDLERGTDLMADKSKQTILHCYTDVVWYKNGDEISDSPQRTLHEDGFALAIHQLRAEDAGLYKCKPIMSRE